jgi:hypothetical protein
VLRGTTSRGLRGLVCPSRTSERGGEGDCVKEGGGGEGERERERAQYTCANPVQNLGAAPFLQGDILDSYIVTNLIIIMYHPRIWRGHGRHKSVPAKCRP